MFGAFKKDYNRKFLPYLFFYLASAYSFMKLIKVSRGLQSKLFKNENMCLKYDEINQK